MGRAVPLRASRSSLRAPAAEGFIVAGASLLLAYLAIVPMATMLYASFHVGFLSDSAHWSPANYTRAFFDSAFDCLLGNTLAYGAAVAVLAIVLGFGLAFLYARTDAPLRRLGGVVLTGLRDSVACGAASSHLCKLRNDVELSALPAVDAQQYDRLADCGRDRYRAHGDRRLRDA